MLDGPQRLVQRHTHELPEARERASGPSLGYHQGSTKSARSCTGKFVLLSVATTVNLPCCGGRDHCSPTRIVSPLPRSLFWTPWVNRREALHRQSSRPTESRTTNSCVCPFGNDSSTCL